MVVQQVDQAESLNLKDLETKKEDIEKGKQGENRDSKSKKGPRLKHLCNPNLMTDDN